MRQSGQLRSVQSVRQGGVMLSADGAGTIRMASAADFPADGGTFTVGTDATVYSYTSTGEDDQSELLLGATWPTAPTTTETWLNVAPPAWEMWAEVEIAGAEGALSCIVPHFLRPLLVEGTRSEDDREGVWVERVGQAWQVVDIIGRKAEVQPGGIAPGAVTVENLDSSVPVGGGSSALVGAGRPDQPGSMNTELAAKVAAAPTGTVFISTTKSQGVTAWIRTYTSATTSAKDWTVLDGDTGWVTVTPYNGWTGTLKVRRLNQVALVRGENLVPATATTDRAGDLPAGFHPGVTETFGINAGFTASLSSAGRLTLPPYTDKTPRYFNLVTTGFMTNGNWPLTF